MNVRKFFDRQKNKYFHKNTKVIFQIFVAEDCEFITEEESQIIETLMVTWFLACWIFSLL